MELGKAPPGWYQRHWLLRMEVSCKTNPARLTLAQMRELGYGPIMEENREAFNERRNYILRTAEKREDL